MVFLVALMYAIWSSSFAVGKIALITATPLFLTATRMLLGGTLLLCFVYWKNKNHFLLRKKEWLSLFALGFFSVFLANILEFWGLQYLSAAKTCFIYSLSPFFAALFSYLHFGEKMSLQRWLGLSIGFAGMIPVFMLQTGSEELFTAFSFFSWPTLALIGAALTSVYGWVLLRMIVKEQAVSTPLANGVSMLFGGLLALTTSSIWDMWNPTPIISGKGSLFVISISTMTIVYNLICYNLYGWLLKRFTATFLSLMGLLSPLFASVSGWIFLQEPFSWPIIASTAIVSIGLVVTYQTELKQKYIK